MNNITVLLYSSVLPHWQVPLVESWLGYVSIDFKFINVADRFEGNFAYGWRGQLEGVEMDFHSCMFWNHMPSPRCDDFGDGC